jgi:DNA-binding PadR family transcriptional regulator
MFDRHNARRGHRQQRFHHREPRMGPRPPMWLRDVIDPFRAGHQAVRRGDIRQLILSALRDKPMHGYQVIQELETQSGGRWRPSAGSVYPTLQQLEDEGLVRSEDVEGRRTYSLTDDGRAVAAATPAGRGPWADSAERDDAVNVRHLAMQLVAAVMQVSRIGSPQMQRDARDILVNARRSIYRLLAEDDDSDSARRDPGTAPKGAPR